MPRGIPNRKSKVGRLFVAKEAFTTLYNGFPIGILKGITAREGHPILAGREHLFVPLKVDYELEDQPEEVEEEEEVAPVRVATPVSKPEITRREQDHSVPPKPSN